MNGHLTTTDYAERLEGFRRIDAQRDAFVAEILKNYEELRILYADKCADYDNEVYCRRDWQRKWGENEKALTAVKQTSNSNNFVLVIIDGDGAPFTESLIREGKEGGTAAAHRLHGEIKKQLKETYPDSAVDDWSILVQVVLNLQGMATKLQSCGFVANQNEFLAFGRAFSLAQPLFSFIDVGHGKERADHKIRETLRLFIPNSQCKHVFFGPCHDNGYLVVLEGYAHDHGSRMTLIETRPAERGFNALNLKKVSFPTVFTPMDLPQRRGDSPVAMLATPAATPGAAAPRPPPVPTMSVDSAPFIPKSTSYPTPKSSSPAPSIDSNASGTWATVGRSASAARTIDISTKKVPEKKFLLLNVYDDRVDAPLPTFTDKAEKNFYEKLKAGKFCNDFHLRGKCRAARDCQYKHGERLPPGENLVLKHKARSLVCADGTLCRDFDCPLGHHCNRYGAGCRMDCRFADTHNMDMEAAKKLYEDETMEWIQAYLDKCAGRT